jgi:hypothetical protein
MDEDQAQFPADVAIAHDADTEPDRSRRLVQRFAAGIARCYRTMDPVVAQVVATPGVTLVVPAED